MMRTPSNRAVAASALAITTLLSPSVAMPAHATEAGNRLSSWRTTIEVMKPPPGAGEPAAREPAAKAPPGGQAQPTARTRPAAAAKPAAKAPATTGSLPPAAAAEPRPAALTGRIHQLEGIASFYWQEQKTANGERFDKMAMTAAHRTLPFNTRVRVTNLSNGRSVVVRINDRGPFKPGRVIDLSWAAADVIDMRAKGLAMVKVEVME